MQSSRLHKLAVAVAAAGIAAGSAGAMAVTAKAAQAAPVAMVRTLDPAQRAAKPGAVGINVQRTDSVVLNGAGKELTPAQLRHLLRVSNGRHGGDAMTPDFSLSGWGWHLIRCAGGAATGARAFWEFGPWWAAGAGIVGCYTAW
jgi:hypothetical protein